MQTILLPAEDVLAGYDAMAALYPHIPPLCTWRGWEHAGYRRYALPGPVLDVGCGDGRFFKMVWPDANDVVGVDMDAATAEQSRGLGVYREVHHVAAHEMDFPAGTFGSAFANCALEHMDQIDRVLANIAKALKPGAPFLCSVVTANFIKWAALPMLVRLAGEPGRADALQRHHDAYHHHVNTFTAQGWLDRFAAAGFEAVEHAPIVPLVTAQVVTFFDHLWHLPYPGGYTGEVGGNLHGILISLHDFPTGFRKVLEGAMWMEKDRADGAGGIFWLRKRG